MATVSVDSASGTRRCSGTPRVGEMARAAFGSGHQLPIASAVVILDVTDVEKPIVVPFEYLLTGDWQTALVRLCEASPNRIFVAYKPVTAMMDKKISQRIALSCS